MQFMVRNATMDYNMPAFPKKPSIIKTRSSHQRLITLLLSACIAVLYFESAQGVPADPQLHELRQPDGTTIKVRLRGDEHYHWNKTAEGYAVIKDAKDGFWKFAQSVACKAEFRGIPNAHVGTDDPGKLGLHKHDLPKQKVLREHIQKRREGLQGTPVELSSLAANSRSSQFKSSPIQPRISVAGVKNVKNIGILACLSNHWEPVNNTGFPAYGRVDTNEYYNLYNQVGYNADGALDQPQTAVPGNC